MKGFGPLLLCMGLSGFAALVYETAWLRSFATVFGTAEGAVAAVLAAYMAGLAVGGVVGGRLARRVRRPLLVYAGLEIVAAAAALAVGPSLHIASRAQAVLLGGQAALPSAGPSTALLVPLGLAFLLLLVPTACLGATLPVLVRHAVHRPRDIGARTGALYAVNTAGAVAGTLTAAFVLLPALGLWRTIATGAAAGAAAAGLAGVLGLRGDRDAAAGVAPAAPPSTETRARIVVVIVLLSGMTAFAYEVVWTRLVGHLLGGSVTAFATMLASVLAGIALGSAAGGRLATSRVRAAGWLAITQLGAAVVALATFRLADALPALAGRLGAGDAGHVLANAAVSAGVLVPLAACLGAVYPLAVRVSATSAESAGPAAGRIYAWNTAGGIAGALGAGYVALPVVGFAPVVLGAAAVNAGVAVLALALVDRRRPVWGLAAVAVATVALVVGWPRTPDGLLRSSPLDAMPATGAAVARGVGRSATVLVVETDGFLDLRVNGMPEARIARAGSPPGWEWTRWLTAMPALVRPDARSLLIIGLGGGASVLGAPSWIESIDVVELEPAVVAVNRRLAGRRVADPLADPRLHLVINDARRALALTSRTYDIVVSQPSHPWSAGASHLYTREHLALVRRRLAADGVLVQWMNSRFVDAALLRTLGATLLEAFAHVTLFNPYPDMLVFIASDAELDVMAAGRRLSALAPSDADVLAAAGIHRREEIAAALLMDHAGLVASCGGAPVNTDDHNRLATRAARARRRGLGPAGMDAFARPYDPLPGPDGPLASPDIDAAEVVRRLVVTDHPDRARMVAEAVTDPTRRALARAALAAAEGDAEAARRQLVAAVTLAPADPAVAYAVARDMLARGDETRAPRFATLSPAASSVVAGWASAATRDWPALRALEPRLAAVPMSDPAGGEALRLRATWRLRAGASGSSRRRSAAEALILLDRFIDVDAPAETLLLRAECGRALARPELVIESVAAAARVMPADPAHAKSLRARGRALLDPINAAGIATGEGQDDALARRRARVLDMLGR